MSGGLGGDVPAILALDRVRVMLRGRHGDVPLLRGVSLRVQPGEVHGLVGESGAGKSMIGRTVLGLLPPRARVAGGRVLYRGRDLLAEPASARAGLLGRDIAVIPQDPAASLNPVRRIGRQMQDVLRLRAGMRRRAAWACAEAMLAEVWIRDPGRVMRSYPHQLSGGQRQRVLIAIAFASAPRLIVADEPTTALDVTVQREILRLIQDLQARGGASVLFVTHDLGVVAKLCATVTVLHAGRVLEQGRTAEVLAKPAHPYTRALLDATPHFGRPGDALRPVPPGLLAALQEEATLQDARTGA